MDKVNAIELGAYYEKFIEEKISTGKFISASEVIRTALRLFELEENSRQLLVNELILGEESGVDSNFDRDIFLKELHLKNKQNEN